MDLPPGRHLSTVGIARFFEYQHLPVPLRAVSAPCHDLAEAMIGYLPDGPELTTGLRKLLEAKDCFVRAALDGRDQPKVLADGTKLSRVYPAGGMQPVGEVPTEGGR